MKIKAEHVLLMFTLVFVLIYSYLPSSTPPKFTSPDEVVSLFFSNLYTRSSTLSYIDNINRLAYGIIHPRNTVYINDHVAPGSFLGMYIIYGTFGVLNSEIILYLTPIIAGIGVLSFFCLLREYFHRRIALLSAFLLLIYPPYWYWASNTMFNNVLALVIFIIGLLYLTRGIKKLPHNSNNNILALAGLFLGLSIFVRLDYTPTTLVAIVILLITVKTPLSNIHKLIKELLVKFLLFLALPLLVLLQVNKSLYGSFIISPTQIYFSGDVAPQVTSYDFDIFKIMENFINFFIKLQPIWSFMTLIGIILCVILCIKSKNNDTTDIKRYLYVFFCLSIVLVFFYLPAQVWAPSITLFSSFVRYLLLIYILSIPFIVFFLEKLRPYGFYKIVIILLIMTLIFNSVTVVYLTDPTNIVFLREKKIDYQETLEKFENLVEPNSIIFVQYYDKILFPELKVGYFGELPEKSSLLAEITVNLVEQENINIYILNDRPNLWDIDIFSQQLEKEGYELRLIKKEFYKVIRK